MTARSASGGWGPERRRATVALAFAGLGTTAPGHVVTPALPTLLRVLGDRDLPATFFVEDAIAAGEQMALTMIELGGHELHAASGGDGVATSARAALQAAGVAAGDVLDDGGEVPPAVLHASLQAAVGRTLPRGGLLAVLLTPSRFERRDALDVLVESADLIAGLRRAGSIWTPRLAELAADGRPG